MSRNGFREKIDRAGFHRLRTHRDVAVPCDEDELFFPAPLNQNILQIHSVDSGHTHIHNHARRPGMLVTREKIRRGTKASFL